MWLTIIMHVHPVESEIPFDIHMPKYLNNWKLSVDIIRIEQTWISCDME